MRNCYCPDEFLRRAFATAASSYKRADGRGGEQHDHSHGGTACTCVCRGADGARMGANRYRYTIVSF